MAFSTDQVSQSEAIKGVVDDEDEVFKVASRKISVPEVKQEEAKTDSL